MPRPAARLACASPACRPLPGRHIQVCLDDVEAKCDGCLPRLAADGLRLCPLCTRRLAEDPFTLVVRHRDLGRVLVGGIPGRGEHVTASRDPNLKLNPLAVDARHLIRTELVALVRLVVAERGVSLPTFTLRRVAPRPFDGFVGPMPLIAGSPQVDSSLPALARFVARHAMWLAAHPAAGEHAAGLRGLVRSTFGVAHPSGLRMFEVRVPGGGVASCPERVRRRTAFAVDGRGRAVEVFGLVACDGSLWTVIRPGDDVLPAELLCSLVEVWPLHRWPARGWLRLGAELRRRAEAAAAAAGSIVEEGAAA